MDADKMTRMENNAAMNRAKNLASNGPFPYGSEEGKIASASAVGAAAALCEIKPTVHLDKESIEAVGTVVANKLKGQSPN